MTELELRFISKTEPYRNCLKWTGCKLSSGYGRIMYAGKVRLAHRVSMFIYRNFDLDSTLCICHACDNKWCVNPDHLFAGSHADNRQDGIRKGLINPSNPGMRNGRAVISAEDADEILRLRSCGWTVKQIKNYYGISQQPIYAVLSGKHWSKNAPK